MQGVILKPINNPPSSSSSSSSSSSKPKKDKTPALPSVEVIPENLNTLEFLATWQEWKNYRAEKKKKLTPTGAATQLKRFSEWGVSRSIAAIEHTIFSGWEGIREPDVPKRQAADEYTGPFLNAEEEEIDRIGRMICEQVAEDDERKRKEAQKNETHA
jgi:hypothetical protein